MLENVNERLVKEDRHFVKVNSGRIQVSNNDKVNSDEKLVYQRVCLSTDDGGVVCLDWPENLDLEEEHGLDSTLLIVPGTAEGSNEEKVRAFVVESLSRGCFPVVMNPRGCAGSPLTTARLFTAADSDDISTAIQFINKKRPWSTLLGVGWGYGANMLTKYLAEVGEKTPLTAATCIDNPFDLEEATRTTPYHIAFGQNLTRGLVDILQSNKELFQGRAKGFDVKNALLASSVRDFEKAISMVSYGFNSIEDFYAKSSTRDVVGKVEIPLLFIQNDDGAIPLFSVPRCSIAENPYTSLLLCSYLPHIEMTNSSSTQSWCQHLTIEWLTAVELGLLKGRHPLLKDVDITINPSEGLALVGGLSDRSLRSNNLLNLPKSDALESRTLDPSQETLQEGDIAATVHSSYGVSRKDLPSTGQQQGTSSTLQNYGAADAESGEEEAGSPLESERGQVLHAAEVVMNMLDVTMPDTLTEEQKKKVLMAVGQGETGMKALQDAVPDDVRGKLTTAVSGILHNQGSNIKFDRLLSLGQIPNVTSKLKSKVEKVGEVSNTEGGSETHHLSDDNRAGDFSDKLDKNPKELDSEPKSLDDVQKSVDTGQSQPISIHGSEDPTLDKKDRSGLENSNQNADLSVENTALTSDYKEHESKVGAKHESSSGSEGDDGTENIIDEKSNVPYDGGKYQTDLKEETSSQQKEENIADMSNDQNEATSSTQTEDKTSPATSPSETNVLEKDGAGDFNRDESMQTNSSPILPNNPSFDVSQALEALTGIDDSTQVAVNSVFDVLGDMITQLEVERDTESEIKDGDNEEGLKDRDKVVDHNTSSVSNDHPTDDNPELDDVEENGSNVCSTSDVTDNVSSFNQVHSQEKSEKKHILFDQAESGNVSFLKSNGEIHPGSEQMRKKFIDGELPAGDSHKYLNKIPKNVPRYMTTNLYGHPFYKEYLQSYLSSKAVRTKPLDLDTTTALFLDYFPEDRQWKLLEQIESNGDVDVAAHERMPYDSSLKTNNMDNVIEPSYIIFDDENQVNLDEERETSNNSSENVGVGNDTTHGSSFFVRNILMDALKVELGRKLSTTDMEEMQPELSSELEHVANAISETVGHGEELVSFINSTDLTSDKVGKLPAEHIIRAISSAVQGTSYLRRVLPVGVIVGCCLAALRKFFDISAVDSNGRSKELILDWISEQGNVNCIQTANKGNVNCIQTANKGNANCIQTANKGNDRILTDKTNQAYGLQSPDCKVVGAADSEISDNNKSIMVGAVTAALGASALLVHHQDAETIENSSKPYKSQNKEACKLDEETNDKTHNNIVTSLAEKAMSVAGPVVPTTENGAVDQERLVTMLAELGQRGGVLKLVAKIALLWGGIRGAISLTDKLISFLHIAERPLFPRILGFSCMVLVLWSPVVVPLLPTLVQSWMQNNPSKMAELVCIIGLYMSILFQITLWGKRIRGYEDSLKQYGMDLASRQKVQSFLKGLIGGVILVLLIHFVNSLMGCVHFCFPMAPPTSSAASLTYLKLYVRVFILFVRGLATATGVAIVEELLFRSWLPDEIAIDLGYYRGIIISGLVFALFQRSPWAVPGLWLLSLALEGARQRSQGGLFLSIGLRAGILASSFILQIEGFLTYQPKFPPWFMGSYPAQPFSGVVGIAFALPLAILLYPRNPLQRKKIARKIKE